MRKYTFTQNGFTFERIDKKAARTAYNNGLSVLWCPCNLNPSSPWGLAVNVNKNHAGNVGKTFETVLNAFLYYNCTNAETGKYAAFYIPVKTVDRFTGETPTAATLGTVKQYDYKYTEV